MAEGAHVLVLVTEWNEFRQLDKARLRQAMHQPYLIDGRNIYDPADVFWALTNRVDWSQDIFTVPFAQGHEMDPTANSRGVHTKIGVDATSKKERRGYEERVRYSGVDLRQYLPGA